MLVRQSLLVEIDHEVIGRVPNPGSDRRFALLSAGAVSRHNVSPSGNLRRDGKRQLMASMNHDRAARAAVYQLLARLWAEEPQMLLEQLKAVPMAAAWRQLGGSLPENESDNSSESLDEDYCRLFVGPTGHLPPIQSVWMHGELDTAVTSSLREFDTVVGFEEPWSFAIIPDHLGNELWAMSQILRKSDGLSSDGQSAAHDLARQFFVGHLRWADQFLRAVADREGDRFYGTVASITLRFLDDEAARLEISAIHNE